MIGAIAAHYVAATGYAAAVLADSPRGYWRLGDLAGTTMTDSSGSARNGTYSGSPTLGATSLLTSDTTDKSVDFSGTGQYGTVSFAAWMAAGQFSIDAFVNMDSTSGNRTILSRRATGTGFGNQAWQLRIAAGKVSLLVFTDTTTVTECLGATTLSTGTTYHVAGTYDGATLRVYLNGTQDGTATRSGSANSTTSAAITLAASFDSGSAAELMDGRIDEVAYYGSALSAARIAAHYAAR